MISLESNQLRVRLFVAPTDVKPTSRVRYLLNPLPRAPAWIVCAHADRVDRQPERWRRGT